MAGSGHRPHREFFAVPLEGDVGDDASWRQVDGFNGKIDELVLSDTLDHESRTGSRTRLTRWAPGILLGGLVEHEYREEIFLLDGDLVVGCDGDGNGGEFFHAYTFAGRPAGIIHGPFTTRTGCLMLEFDIYD